MINRTKQLVEKACMEAESVRRLVVPTERAQRRHMQSALSEELVIEPYPHMYARHQYWESLKIPQRARHIISSIAIREPGIVFAGPSAALIYGFSVSHRHLGNPCMATTRKTHRESSAHRSCVIVSNDQISEIDGIRVTSPARTVYDCLRVMDFKSGLALADSALRVGAMSREMIAADITSLGSSMRDKNRVLSVVALADWRAESGGESIARATMLELCLASPDLQHVFPSPLDGTRYRADFSWNVGGFSGTDRFIVGELDGHEKYTDSQMTRGKSIEEVIDDEHRRESHLAACHEIARVVRFSFADVLNYEQFGRLLVECGVPVSHRCDQMVLAAGGKLCPLIG